MKMKNYRITYKQLVSPKYKIIDPYNPFNIRNMDEIVLISDDKTYTKNIKAPNKSVAKGLLAVHIYEDYLGIGCGKCIVMNALMNIQAIEEIKADGDDDSET